MFISAMGTVAFADVESREYTREMLKSLFRGKEKKTNLKMSRAISAKWRRTNFTADGDAYFQNLKDSWK